MGINLQEVRSPKRPAAAGSRRAAMLVSLRLVGMPYECCAAHDLPEASCTERAAAVSIIVIIFWLWRLKEIKVGKI
jgi:hypothetical protein